MTILITQQPSSAPKQIGQSLYLDVLADGVFPITYQWQDNSSGSFADLASQTQQFLLVPALTYAMRGRQYRVNVTDSGGTVTSSVYELDIAGSREVRLFNRPDALATGASALKFYNGSVWTEKPLKVFNGTTWDVKPVLMWNGSSWQ